MWRMAEFSFLFLFRTWYRQPPQLEYSICLVSNMIPATCYWASVWILSLICSNIAFNLFEYSVWFVRILLLVCLNIPFGLCEYSVWFVWIFRLICLELDTGNPLLSLGCIAFMPLLALVVCRPSVVNTLLALLTPWPSFLQRCNCNQFFNSLKLILLLVWVWCNWGLGWQ